MVCNEANTQNTSHRNSLLCIGSFRPLPIIPLQKNQTKQISNFNTRGSTPFFNSEVQPLSLAHPLSPFSLSFSSFSTLIRTWLRSSTFEWISPSLPFPCPTLPRLHPSPTYTTVVMTIPRVGLCSHIQTHDWITSLSSLLYFNSSTLRFSPQFPACFLSRKDHVWDSVDR